MTDREKKVSVKVICMEGTLSVGKYQVLSDSDKRKVYDR